MLPILALAATALAVDVPLPGEGLPGQEEGTAEVWNGTRVGDDRALEGVVALLVGSFRDERVGGVFCSGTLIDPEWVLTAAHCLIGAEDQAGSGWGLYAGVGPSFPFDSRIAWDEYFIHPQYDDAAGAGAGYDVGLVHLAEPVRGVATIPVNTQKLDASFAGLPVSVVGYGITEDDGDDSGTKRQADLFLVNFQGDLLRLFNGSVWYDDSSGLYQEAEWDSTSNACQGDSGGASLARSTEGDWVLVGINAIVYNGCAHGGTGSTRTDLYADWISRHVPLDGSGGVDGGDEPEDVYTLEPVGEGTLRDPGLGEPLTPADALGVLDDGCDVTGGASAGLLATLLALLGRRRR